MSSDSPSRARGGTCPGFHEAHLAFPKRIQSCLKIPWFGKVLQFCKIFKRLKFNSRTGTWIKLNYSKDGGCLQVVLQTWDLLIYSREGDQTSVMSHCSLFCLTLDVTSCRHPLWLAALGKHFSGALHHLFYSPHREVSHSMFNLSSVSLLSSKLQEGRLCVCFAFSWSSNV